MLISQSHSTPPAEQGCSRTEVAELRRRLADPSTMDSWHRQRLVKLAKRLARVRALGDEYLRVSLSEHATEVLLNDDVASAVV